jgi:hypothetical protein
LGTAFERLLGFALDGEVPDANIDDIERAAIAAEGYDPDDPAVVAPPAV